MEELIDVSNWKDQLPNGIYEFAFNKFKQEIDKLYHADLYVIPLTVEGEAERERLYDENSISRYGAYEINFKYDNETFLAIIVNND